MRFFKLFQEYILFLITLFLLIFIPLYPKLPLLDIRNTWVYIRIDDVIVLGAIFVWLALLLQKKINLKTPLTMPILIFWIIGAIATIHGVILIFPTLANVFPNVAFLSYLRRIEYLSLFFIAYSSIREKKQANIAIVVLSLTLLLVIGYGVGQRYLGFPAYLTMNEEFAKGEPIKLSSLSRIPSTFAGHYDLAAYLVLVLPILTSMIFGVRNWIYKVFFAISVALGFILMFMTVSRVSFFVLLIAVGIVLLFQKKKIILLAIPVGLVSLLFLLSFSHALLNRFGNTIEEVDVLVDASTGEAIGQAKQVESTYFKDKILIQDYALNSSKVEGVSIYKDSEKLFDNSNSVLATVSADLSPTVTGVIPYYFLPEYVTLLLPANISTGENLPQGTGYINLSLSPVVRKIGQYFYEKEVSSESSTSADAVIINGNYLVKRASAYDLSFTTRFQGEWPHAIKAFMRNILFGSGYGAVSLAIDNNYFRLLGEVGLLGLSSFLIIFITSFMYIRKNLRYVDSPLIKSMVIGYICGVIGLGLNATLIDVFEASKVAYILWLITGVVLGTLHLYQKENFNSFKELSKTVFSTPAVFIYLLITAIFVFSPMINNYFVGDDFTWFRWAAETNNYLDYFTKADGFFYRPGTKIFFSLMYRIFWLNQTVYHSISIFLHFIVSVLVFFLAKKVLKENTFATLAAFFFLLISGYHEAVFWISSIGYLFTAIFMLASLLVFSKWLETKKVYFLLIVFVLLLFSVLFHELGVVTFLILILFKYLYEDNLHLAKLFNEKKTFIILLPSVIYIIIRYLASSHWSGGDYSYNLVKLPLNFVGNLIGYLQLLMLGPISLSFYEIFRNFFKEKLILSAVLFGLFVMITFLLKKYADRHISKEERILTYFSLGIFIIGLLPFLGLGNISSRYGYLSSVGLVLLMTLIIKKIYFYLLNQGKDIALAGISVFITLFMLFHLMQTQQIHSDWKTAGRKAERFLIAIDEVYEDYWTTTPMKFYFVNVPIKTGEAWIFPVGINDALWFSFRNPNIIINNSTSVSNALDQVSSSREEKVFEIENDGNIKEYKKFINNYEEN